MNDRSARRASGAELFGLTTLVILAVAYILLRYGGGWSLGNDATLFTRVTRIVDDHGSLLPPAEVYPNGFGYQALLVFASKLTGLSLYQLQSWAFPLLLAWLVIPLWLLYRELLPSRHAAALAVVILFLQPELIFVSLRGTHEKFTRGLMVLCLFFLARSIRSRDKPRVFAGLALAFSLTAAAVVHFNIYFSTSLLLAIFLAMPIVYLLRRLSDRPVLGSQDVTSLLFMGSIFAVLTFAFIFYTYPPASYNLRIVESATDRIAALFLDAGTTEREIVNPYAKWLQNAWINLPVYAVMTVASWLLLFGSVVIWAWQAMKWLAQRRVSGGEGEVLLWVFFGAFGFLSFVSILADLSGALSGNLQHRAFPSFAVFAAPVVSRWLFMPWARKKWVRTLLIGLFAIIAILSLLKATPEPLLSNTWQYVLPAEMQSAEWAHTHLPGRRIWTSFDSRLSDSIANRRSEPAAFLTDRFAPNAETRDFLISELTEHRADRLGADLPLHADDFVTYDNGQARIYHRRPKTPYQR